MKKLVLTMVAGLTLLMSSQSVFAADAGKGKEETIKGEAKCAKCALGESKKCQTVIQSKDKDGKVTTYWLTDNDVSKGVHKDICHSGKEVTATGTVEEKDGKEELTATKITMAK